MCAEQHESRRVWTVLVGDRREVLIPRHTEDSLFGGKDDRPGTVQSQLQPVLGMWVECLERLTEDLSWLYCMKYAAWWLGILETNLKHCVCTAWLIDGDKRPK